MDNMRRIRAGPTTETVNFGDLWDCLRSKDESLMNGIFSDDFNQERFLKMKGRKTPSSTNQRVSFSTYPRCGNSFFRKYCQMITGIATGSDMLLELNVDM
jgi:hypothetical protein